MAHPPVIDFLRLPQLHLLLLVEHRNRVIDLLWLTFPGIIFSLTRVCWTHRNVAWIGGDWAAVFQYVPSLCLLLREDVLSSSEKQRCLLLRRFDFRLNQP